MGDVTSWDQGPVRVLAIDRPERANATATSTAIELTDGLRAADADREIGAVVLTGMGEHFSSGGDAYGILDAIAEGDEGAARMMRSFGRLVEEIWNSPLPVVAAVGGITYGGGFNIALACDLVICAADTRFCQVFLRRGLVPDVGGAWLLPRLVGMQRAKELLLLTPEIDAKRAHDLGLVNVIEPDADAARARAVGWARELAGRSPVAMSLAKKLINTSSAVDLHSSLELEAASQTAALQSRPAKEGFEEFLRSRGRQPGDQP